MKTTNNLTDFESCKNMIYKLAHNRYKQMKGKRPDIELDDLIAEGYSIYCWCLKNYSSSKGMKFTSFLYMNLNQRLLDYYMCTLKLLPTYEDFNFTDRDGSEVRFEDNIISPEYDQNIELLEKAKEELSYEGFQVLKYIISREWQDNHHVNKPAEYQISKKFGYQKDILSSIMSELSKFWNNKGWMIA